MELRKGQPQMHVVRKPYKNRPVDALLEIHRVDQVADARHCP